MPYQVCNLNLDKFVFHSFLFFLGHQGLTGAKGDSGSPGSPGIPGLGEISRALLHIAVYLFI